MDRSHPINTPTSGSKISAFADGKAPLMDQSATFGDGPKFKSTLERNDEATTSCKSCADRKL